MQVKDLKKQYEVKRIDETEGKEYLVWNAKTPYRRYHDNLEDAKYTMAHDKKIWSKNKSVILANGIGIETEHIYNHTYSWTRRWRWVSKWEEIEE